MSETTLSRRALNRATLARQMLLRRETLKPVAAIERLAGMQAQIPRPPFVGLWSRLEPFRREDLVRAIDRRDVVRATMMRATLHLVSRKDFLSLRPVLQPVLSRAMASVLRDRASKLDEVRFLPEFDNLLLGYADRTRIIADEHKPAIYTRNLLVPATFLVDGFVAGMWNVERKKRIARLVLKPFGMLSKPARNALAEEGEKLLRFVEPDAETRSVDLARAKRQPTR